MNIDWKKYGPYIAILILLAIVIVQCSKQPDTIKVPVKVEVPIPVIEKEFDTIKDPYPVYIPGKKEIDSTYYDKYVQLKDSVAKDSMFKEAITIREYKQKFEDDTITIDVYSKVQGFLKEQQVSYKTKERTIPIDIEVEVPTKYQPKFGGEIEIGFPTGKTVDRNIVVKPGLLLDTKNLIYKVSYDTQKRVWGGISIKF